MVQIYNWASSAKAKQIREWQTGPEAMNHECNAYLSWRLRSFVALFTKRSLSKYESYWLMKSCKINAKLALISGKWQIVPGVSLSHHIMFVISHQNLRNMSLDTKNSHGWLLPQLWKGEWSCCKIWETNKTKLSTNTKLTVTQVCIMTFQWPSSDGWLQHFRRTLTPLGEVIEATMWRMYYAWLDYISKAYQFDSPLAKTLLSFFWCQSVYTVHRYFWY